MKLTVWRGWGSGERTHKFEETRNEFFDHIVADEKEFYVNVYHSKGVAHYGILCADRDSAKVVAWGSRPRYRIHVIRKKRKANAKGKGSRSS